MNLRIERRIAAARLSEMGGNKAYLQNLEWNLRGLLESVRVKIALIDKLMEAEKASVNNPVDTPEQKQ